MAVLNSNFSSFPHSLPLSLSLLDVNVPQCWEHMLLTCLVPAQEGGDNILVSATSIYQELERKHPQLLPVLAQDFWWEFRGFSDRFYRAPILFFNRRGEPCLRWLREYMESAHARLKIPLTPLQLEALNTLSELTRSPALQFYYSFKAGEVLIANDLHLLHGRTAFRDAAPASEEYNFSQPVNRLMQRNWLESHQLKYRGINQSRYWVPDTQELQKVMSGQAA